MLDEPGRWHEDSYWLFDRFLHLLGLERFSMNVRWYFVIFVAEKDWDDIKFGVENKVDFYAVSFVKDAKVVHELKDYLRSSNILYFS